MFRPFSFFNNGGRKPNMTNILERHYDKPLIAWNLLEKSQVVKTVEPLDASTTPKPPNHTRFVCISDTHGLKNPTHSIPDGDVLIHAGDFTMIGKKEEVRKFNEFFISQSHPHKLVIAGNHDLPFDVEGYEFNYEYWKYELGCGYEDPLEIKSLLDVNKCTYLEDSEVTINGHRIYGSPWVPVFGAWCFMLERGEKLKEKWDKIPDGIDVLVTHGPPLGHGDLCYDGSRAGCLHLLDTIQNRVKPKYHVFGHIHEGYGVQTDDVTTYANASIANVRYRPSNKPIVFDLPDKI